jgi:hypothetical protein
VAFVHLPADSVTAARRDLDQRAVRSAVVIGNGFKLSHSAARQDLVQFLGSPGRGLRLVGPNCVGLLIEGIDIDWLPEVRQAMNHYGKQGFVVKVTDTDLGRMPPVSSVVGMSVSGRAA